MTALTVRIKAVVAVGLGSIFERFLLWPHWLCSSRYYFIIIIIVVVIIIYT